MTAPTGSLDPPRIRPSTSAWLRFGLVLAGALFGCIVTLTSWSDLGVPKTLGGIGLTLTSAAVGALGRSPRDARRLS